MQIQEQIGALQEAAVDCEMMMDEEEPLHVDSAGALAAPSACPQAPSMADCVSCQREVAPWHCFVVNKVCLGACKHAQSNIAPSSCEHQRVSKRATHCMELSINMRCFRVRSSGRRLAQRNLSAAARRRDPHRQVWAWQAPRASPEA